VFQSPSCYLFWPYICYIDNRILLLQFVCTTTVMVSNSARFQLGELQIIKHNNFQAFFEIRSKMQQPIIYSQFTENNLSSVKNLRIRTQIARISMFFPILSQKIQRFIKGRSKVHWRSIEGPLKVHWKFIEGPLKVHRRFIEGSSKVHQRFIEGHIWALSIYTVTFNSFSIWVFVSHGHW